MWSRFVVELVTWPQEVALARWTQPSGPLCLWQCYNYWTTLKVCYFGLDIFGTSDFFWAFHETQFWKSFSSRLGLEMVTYLLQPVTIVGSPLLLMDWPPLIIPPVHITMAHSPIMGWSSAHGKRQIDKRIRQSQILEEGSNTSFWFLVIRGALALPPIQGNIHKSKKTSQELQMLSRSLSDRKSLLLNVMVQVSQFVSKSQLCH